MSLCVDETHGNERRGETVVTPVGVLFQWHNTTPPAVPAP